jgi:excisionase family DNA binding protein
MGTNTRSVTKMAWGITEIATALGLSHGFVRKEIARGALKGMKVGRRVLVLDEELRRYLGRNTVVVAECQPE